MRWRKPFLFCHWNSCSQAKNYAQRPLASNHKETKFLVFESFPTHAITWKWLAGNSWCWSKLFLRLARILIEQCLQFSVSEGFWPSFTQTVVNIEITVIKATEPIKARCFTYRSISVNFLEFSMRFSRRFLRTKEKVNTSRKWRLYGTKSDIFT